jgi:two-component system, OmpR family, sensor kinase
MSDRHAAPDASLELAAAVAHELKSPLAAIRGAARALVGGEPVDDAARQRLVGVIEDAAAQAERLVTDLLTAGRLGAGRLPVQVRPVDVAPVVKTAVDAALAAREAVSIDVRAEESTLRALVDPDRLRQVLDNLLGNALEHTPQGSRVGVRLTSAGDRIRIEVSDEGSGVPAGERERVFEPSVRLSERRAGTGLGLYLARQLARAMGGDVTLDPRPGAGSTFVVELASSESR